MGDLTEFEKSQLEAKQKADADALAAEIANKNAADALAAEKTKNAALVAQVKSLKSKAPKAVDSDAVTFENGGDTYEIVCKEFHFEGKKYAAQDFLNDKDLQDALIELEAGFLKKV